MPITKRDIDGMQPGSVLWDSGRGSVPGFSVRCQRRDRVFILRFSARGRKRWYTIGRFGAPWTVETARLEAKRLLGQVAAGNDPITAKRESELSKDPTTVSELCDRYMEAARAGLVLTRFLKPKKQSTLDIDVGRIEHHIRPLIGKLAVQDVDPVLFGG
jgi:Arm DNA-binding domain